MVEACVVMARLTSCIRSTNSSGKRRPFFGSSHSVANIDEGDFDSISLFALLLLCSCVCAFFLLSFAFHFACFRCLVLLQTSHSLLSSMHLHAAAFGFLHGIFRFVVIRDYRWENKIKRKTAKCAILYSTISQPLLLFQWSFVYVNVFVLCRRRRRRFFHLFHIFLWRLPCSSLTRSSNVARLHLILIQNLLH